MKKYQYDTIIIGSGVAGITAANKLVKEGFSVALVETYEWGGATPNHGSTHKKYLLAAAETQQFVKSQQATAFDHPVDINWQKLMAYKNAQLKNASEAIYTSLEENDIQLINGGAEFKDAHTVTVNGTNYTAETIVIASGARPRILDIEGKEHIKYSSQFLNAETMPKDIVLIGAGIISFAFMSIASAAGSNVQVIQHNNDALRVFDQDFVSKLIDYMEQDHVSFHFDNTVQSIEKSGDKFIVTTDKGKVITTDAVYSVAGRIPNTEDLALNSADVQFGKQGIDVNGYLQTNQENIYAIGDCNNAEVPKLSSYAVYQGNYVADLLLKNTLKPISYPIPSMSVYSNPKIAQTGYLINDAIKEPELYDIEEIDMSSWLNYHRFNEPIASTKLVIRKADNLVVGASSISNDADILINYFTLLLRTKVTKNDMQDILFAYPTIASDLSKLI